MLKMVLIGLALITSMARADYSPMMLGDATQLSKNKVVVMITEIGNCSFCTAIKRDFLDPLSNAPDFGRFVSIVRIDLESPTALIDFSGDKTSQEKWAESMGVDFAPTVLILDPNTGHRLADDIVGLTNLDFYAFYLEQNIRQGMQKLAVY